MSLPNHDLASLLPVASEWGGGDHSGNRAALDLEGP